MRFRINLRRILKWAGYAALAVTLVLALSFWLLWAFPFWGVPLNYTRQTTVPITPPWALECWLWEDDANTAEAVLELLAGYEEHDFPVRTILIDSPWSTRYNDFKVDEARYPNPEEFFNGLEDRGYRVVLWMTPMVDSSSKDTAITESRDWFEEAKANGYLAIDGKEYRWWKGRGGFIDYTNPEAMKWWRGLQAQVLEWGVDGWKLDGAATFFRSQLGAVPIPYGRTHAGWMTTRGYMDHYYRDEYQHGLTKNPEFITLARSLDGLWAHPEGFAPFDASPVNWVGDQDHTWTLEEEGIEEAILYILESARLGYNIIGSDVAGYSGGEIPPELYIRWAQFSTFCGLFLNGGHGERAMWKRTPQELELVRKFSWLHTELVPYIYTYTVRCNKGEPPLMRPTGDNYEYLFGDSIFVAPIYESSNRRRINLPEGRWRYLFDEKIVYQGPRQFWQDFPLDEFPVYIRDGSIIPLNVTRGYTGNGDRDSEGFDTYLIYPYGITEFTTVHPNGGGETTIAVEALDSSVRIKVSGSIRPHILRVRMDLRPFTVKRDGKTLQPETEWQFTGRKVVIKTTTFTDGIYEIGGSKEQPPAQF